MPHKRNDVIMFNAQVAESESECNPTLRYELRICQCSSTPEPR